MTKNQLIQQYLNMIVIAVNDLNTLLPVEENQIGSDLWKIMLAEKNLRDRYVDQPATSEDTKSDSL